MSLERGLQIVNENLSRELTRLSEQVKDAEARADYWREAWEHAIYTIGDLMRSAAAGEPVTAADLSKLLALQDESPNAPALPKKPRATRKKATP